MSDRYLDTRPHRFAGFETQKVSADAVDIRQYTKLPTADKQKIYELFLRVQIIDSKTATAMSEEQFISALEQAGAEVRRTDGGLIRIVIVASNNIYEGTKGNFIGAAFSFKKTVKKHQAWKESQRKIS